MIDYTFEDLLAAYENVGVRAGMIVHPQGNLGVLRTYEQSSKDAVVADHYRALRQLIGADGTIIVASASMNLCHTDVVFDPETTPSFRMGVLSEYVRCLPGSKRSFHPYVSYAAVGPHADYLTQNVSRHAYGPETPEARMIELDALHVSIGIHPRFSTATNHHLELVMGVPYRYNREYVHKVRRSGSEREELFYQNVWYDGVTRDQNKKLFDRFEARHPLEQAPLGRGFVWSYSKRDFFVAGVQIFKDDIYVWTDRPPERKPYRTWL